MAGCQKADEASEIVGDKQPMLEIIPTAKLGESDEGYLINSSIVFAFKHIDKTEVEAPLSYIELLSVTKY